MSGIELFLPWPPTPANLKCFAENDYFGHNERKNRRNISPTGTEFHGNERESAEVLPPGMLHAVISPANSAVGGSWGWECFKLEREQAVKEMMSVGKSSD